MTRNDFVNVLMYGGLFAIIIGVALIAAFVYVPAIFPDEVRVAGGWLVAAGVLMTVTWIAWGLSVAARAVLAGLVSKGRRESPSHHLLP